jgi:hypothetical protein
VRVPKFLLRLRGGSLGLASVPLRSKSCYYGCRREANHDKYHDQSCCAHPQQAAADF